jgi:hypothetical protein
LKTAQLFPSPRVGEGGGEGDGSTGSP